MSLRFVPPIAGITLLAIPLVLTLAQVYDVQAVERRDGSLRLAQAEREHIPATRPADPAQPVGKLSKDMVERGRYITHDVAMCIICHSPKDDAGRVNELEKFEGDVIPVDSPFPRGRAWADRAPNLRTLVARSEDEVFHLLTTGIRRRTGGPPDGPMPPFRLSENDARAVIAYLKSLD